MRSTFAVVFMFGVPLLVTGMFYFMFGKIAGDASGFDLPVTRVVVVNLDQGSPEPANEFIHAWTICYSAGG